MASLPFTSPPDEDRDYQVGDIVEVYCDHDKDDDRIRDWLEGVIVQVDPKMVAIQFHENVYLTDGWMVPDHVLWCPKDSPNMRRPRRRRRRKSSKS
ncbi:MAG: hypothetical protein PVG14_03130 [Anaerolineales bacterium]